jgi:hypothetical protein
MAYSHLVRRRTATATASDPFFRSGANKLACRSYRVAGTAILLGTAIPSMGRATPAPQNAPVPTSPNPPPPESPPSVDAPLGVERASPDAASTPSSAASVSPTATRAPAARPARRPRPPAIVEFVGGVVGSVGVAPAPAVGATLGGALRWRDVSLGLEGRFDAAASAPTQVGGGVWTSLVLLALAPCGYSGPLLGCALVQGGQMRTSSEAPGAIEKSVPWWAAGARVGAQVPLGGDQTTLRLRSDLLVNLAPQLVQFAGTQAWKAPPVTGSLGLDLVVHFW